MRANHGTTESRVSTVNQLLIARGLRNEAKMTEATSELDALKVLSSYIARNKSLPADPSELVQFSKQRSDMHDINQDEAIHVILVYQKNLMLSHEHFSDVLHSRSLSNQSDGLGNELVSPIYIQIERYNTLLQIPSAVGGKN